MIKDGDPEWVLKWWKVNMFAYSLMAQAVQYYFPVPSAKVGIERVFSGGRDVLGLWWQSMSVETMQWLMLLNEKK
jgi:hAT family C-terminal dimerisation region